jgi:hypothetical protein
LPVSGSAHRGYIKPLVGRTPERSIIEIEAVNINDRARQWSGPEKQKAAPSLRPKRPLNLRHAAGGSPNISTLIRVQFQAPIDKSLIFGDLSVRSHHSAAQPASANSTTSLRPDLSERPPCFSIPEFSPAAEIPHRARPCPARHFRQRSCRRATSGACSRAAPAAALRSE